jgi:hypothetical protein
MSAKRAAVWSLVYIVTQVPGALTPWILLGVTNPTSPVAWPFYVYGFFALISVGNVCWFLFDPGLRHRPGIIAVTVVCQTSIIEGLFAVFYLWLSGHSPGAFSAPLNGIDAAYFAVSTATTTGMGDIHPVSGIARLFVLAQMIISVFLVVIAVVTALQRFAARND